MKCVLMKLKKFCHCVLSMLDHALQGILFFASFLPFCYTVLQDFFSSKNTQECHTSIKTGSGEYYSLMREQEKISQGQLLFLKEHRCFDLVTALNQTVNWSIVTCNVTVAKHIKGDFSLGLQNYTAGLVNTDEVSFPSPKTSCRR